MQEDDLITIAQAAKQCGCAETTIRRAARQGKLPAKQLGRYWVVSKADLEKWIANGGYHPETNPKKKGQNPN